MLSCRRFAPGRISFEQWINCRLGFGISIPEFVAARDGGRYASDVYNAAIPDSGAEVQRSISKSDGARFLLPLGYRASLVTETRRTIERRLICTLHLGERSILKFRISRPSLARDQECHLLRSDIQLSTLRVPRSSTGACRRDERPRPSSALSHLRIAMHHTSGPGKAARIRLIRGVTCCRRW